MAKASIKYLFVSGIFVILILSFVVFDSIHIFYPDAYSAMNVNSISLQNSTFPHSDSTSQRILLIGDSMAFSLMYQFADYCDENGHTFKVVTWVSASTKWFAITDTLDYFIKDFKPTYVMFVIGSNELFINHIKERRFAYVDRIKHKLFKIRTIWIGPPNWTDDTGINELLMAKLGKGRFFLSKNLKFDRNDNAHPTQKSSRMWMDSIASWIKHSSIYPIKLNIPQKFRTEKINPVILKPLSKDEPDYSNS